jgi:hypothetical protein
VSLDAAGIYLPLCVALINYLLKFNLKFTKNCEREIISFRGEVALIFPAYPLFRFKHQLAVIFISKSHVCLFRSFNLCGTGNVCCRNPKTTLPPPIPQKVSTTTQRNILNFDLTNLTNIISTILRPINNTKPIKPPQQPQQPQVERRCVSKKGKKLQERILIDEDHEGDDDDQVGETTFAEYPWMIELLKRDPKSKNFEYKCGAVLSELQ